MAGLSTSLVAVNMSLVAPFNGVFSTIYGLTGSVLLADLSVCALAVGYIFIIYLGASWLWSFLTGRGESKTITGA